MHLYQDGEHSIKALLYSDLKEITPLVPGKWCPLQNYRSKNWRVVHTQKLWSFNNPIDLFLDYNLAVVSFGFIFWIQYWISFFKPCLTSFDTLDFFGLHWITMLFFANWTSRA